MFLINGLMKTFGILHLDPVIDQMNGEYLIEIFLYFLNFPGLGNKYSSVTPKLKTPLVLMIIPLDADGCK